MIEIEAIWRRATNGYHLIARDKSQWSRWETVPATCEEYVQYHTAMDYAEGIEPPNYPVPAIPRDVFISAKVPAYAYVLRNGENGYGWYFTR